MAKKKGLKPIKTAVREHLEAGLTLTDELARKLFSTNRVSASIDTLRNKDGLNIKTSLMRVLSGIGKETEHTSTIAVYWLKAGAYDGIKYEQYDPDQIVECAS
jgi:hypothetical protein